MAITEELYRSFGPKLIDAVVRVVRKEINTLRQEHSLPEYTLTQVATAIKDELDNIPDYPWMNDD